MTRYRIFVLDSGHRRREAILCHGAARRLLCALAMAGLDPAVRRAR